MSSTATHFPPAQPGGGFIARQAIFDAQRRAWGYELFYRKSLTTARSTTQEHRLLLSVATSAFLSPKWQQGPNSYLVLALDPRILADDITAMLPPGRTVFQVREELLSSPALQALLARLRQEKFLVEVSLGSVEAADPAAFVCADVLAVDMLHEHSAALLAKAQDIKAHAGARHILAKNVEEPALFEAAAQGGCSLFQGFFFQKPERVGSKTLPGGVAGSLALLKLVESQDQDINMLARAIQQDAALSYRLLKFLNSPYFGFTREVSSIKVALILAGWQQMRTWLRLVLLAEMKPKGKPAELLFLSAQRARFLELAVAGQGARRKPGRALDPERLLLLGLFSLLDSLFDMEMPDIVASLPLDAELKDTLCGQPTPLLPWLRLAQAFERADWVELGVLAEGLGAEPERLAGAYAESMQWAHSVFNYLG